MLLRLLLLLLCHQQPEPRPDHALAMARFALDCKAKMKALVLKLEKFLGPGMCIAFDDCFLMCILKQASNSGFRLFSLGTADLQMRVGLHSGPVTAGVLRGDRSRFQVW